MKGDLRISSYLVSWLFQLIAAAILGLAAWGKFSGTETSLFVFSEIGMGDTGRVIIGLIEGLSCALLIGPGFAHWGAVLGFATMLGAIIAHTTVLGVNVMGDGGMGVMMLGAVLVSTCVVMFIHRKRLPLVGSALE